MFHCSQSRQSGWNRPLRVLQKWQSIVAAGSGQGPRRRIYNSRFATSQLVVLPDLVSTYVDLPATGPMRMDDSRKPIGIDFAVVGALGSRLPKAFAGSRALSQA